MKTEMTYRTNKLLVATSLVILTMVACEQKDDSALDEKVLAIVNGSKITKTEVDQSLDRLLGEKAAMQITEETTKKTLESLVMMRAIAMKQEQTLDEYERLAIDAKAKLYREELLVEMYLRNNTFSTAPSEAKIKEFYEKYPDRFGADTLYTYEILQTRTQPKSSELENVLKSLSSASNIKNWRDYAKRIQTEGAPIIFIQGRTDVPLLNQKLMSTVKKLNPGEATNIIYFDKKPSIVRLTKIDQKPPKPLSDVRNQIRKTLAMQDMKKSIKKVADELMGQSNIEYLDGPKQ